MIGERLQCVKDSNNEVDKNAVAVVRTNISVNKRGLNISIIASLFLSLPHFTLDVFPIGKCGSDTGQYGMEIHATFYI